jgi:hypothetical protein
LLYGFGWLVGLLTQMNCTPSAFLQQDEDLMEEELEAIWNKAPKVAKETIDADAFVQIYRAIDDLFEDEEEEDDEEKLELETTDDNTSPDNDPELATIFKTLADDKGLVTQETLAKWDEVVSLMDENLLDDQEFNEIWNKLPKTDGQLDLVGFLKFNTALDELFEFDDLEAEEDFDEEEEEEETTATSSPVNDDNNSKGMVDDDDLSPAELYEALADQQGLVGMAELKRWGELQEMLAEGDLLPLELENFFDEIASKSEKYPNKLNRDGFLALYNKIDSLFVEEEEEGEAGAAPQSTASRNKEQLLATLASLNQDEDRLPCGLESTENEQAYVKELVQKLEAEPTNLVRANQGNIEMTEVAGTWELLYSSSSAMAYNKGLSGLGGSFPNGKFGGLKMKLVASKFMTDVEYTERIKVVPDSASFDVTVNGSWELRSSVSLFTGEPSIALTVVPDKVTYGPTSTRADHWKSLGPTNMLDVSYLDDDLRIMRGNTSTDSILIFKRTAK